MIRLETDLSMGKAKWREPSGEMSLISSMVARLLGRGAVIAQPVGLNHESQVRPEEIDPKAVQALACEREWQANLGHERQEEPLQVRVGEAEGASI
jgi:hypothetical protein